MHDTIEGAMKGTIPNSLLSIKNKLNLKQINLPTPFILRDACLGRPCLSNVLVRHIQIKPRPDQTKQIEDKKLERHLCANTST